jgi:hypothetical protein
VTHINDDILAVVGPQLNDGLLAYYRANGATASQLNDAEYQFLIAQGAAPAHVNDMWVEYLTGLGYTGTLDDMRKAFWKDGGATPPVFATFDPANKSAIQILSEGNLRAVSNSAANRGAVFATLGAITGRWYWEILSLTGVTAQGVGIGQPASNVNEYLGSTANDWGYFPTGAYWTAAANQGNGLAYTTNSIIGFALDMAGNLTTYVNGVQSFSVPHGLTGLTWPAGSDSSTGGVSDMVANFGQNGTFGGRVTAGGNKDANGRGDFKYPVPAGYLSLCDKNGASIYLPPPVLVGESHDLIAGTSPNGEQVGYRRGDFGLYLPDDLPLMRRFTTRQSINRLVMEWIGDWTAESFTSVEIARLSTSVVETFGPPNLEAYDGIVTRWRWNVPYKFADGETYRIRVFT